MINKIDNYVELALLSDELSDAKEHLDNLINKMSNDDIGEAEFRINLAHIYSHLNRAWNSRNHVGKMDTELWEEFSRFPKDIEPL